MTEFEKRIKTGNGNKPMTDKQRRFIESLVIDKKVDENYKGYVKKALDNGLNRLQASKIIDFLVSFIEFKKSFVDLGYGSDGMLAKNKLNARDVSSNINKDRLLEKWGQLPFLTKLSIVSPEFPKKAQSNRSHVHRYAAEEKQKTHSNSTNSAYYIPKWEK